MISGGRDIELSVLALDIWMELLGYWPAESGSLAVIQGEARGVDTSAALWCLHRDVPTIGVPADWGRYGRGAGPMRNGVMAEAGDECVAFMKNGSRGTADMIRQMRKRGKPVTVVSVVFMSDDGSWETATDPDIF